MIWVDEEALTQATQAFGAAIHRCRDVRGLMVAPRPRATSVEEIRAHLLGMMATLLRMPVMPQGVVLTAGLPMHTNGDAGNVVFHTWPPKELLERRNVGQPAAVPAAPAAPKDTAERSGPDRPDTPPDADGDPG